MTDPERGLSSEDVDALRARLTSADVQENESLRSNLSVARGAITFLTDNSKRLAREQNELRARLTALADEWEIDRHGNDSRAYRARLECAEELRAAMATPARTPSPDPLMEPCPKCGVLPGGWHDTEMHDEQMP